MFTIHSGDKLFLTTHPDGGSVAYLFHAEDHAERLVQQSESPKARLAKRPISDLRPWLEKLLSDGVDHVHEALAAEGSDGEPISNMHNVRFRLLFMDLGLEKFD